MAARDIRPDWWAKTLAGLLLGFGLAMALVGLLAYLGPGGISATDGRFTTLRFLMPFAWIAVFSLCYLFRSGLAAWLWLGGANLVAFGLLFACRFWFFA